VVFVLLLSFSISNIFSPSLTLTPPTSILPYIAHCHLQSRTVVHQCSSCFILISSSFHCSDYPSNPSFYSGTPAGIHLPQYVPFRLSLLSFLSNSLCRSPTSTPPTSVPPYLTCYCSHSLAVIHHHSPCFLFVSFLLPCSSYPHTSSCTQDPLQAFITRGAYFLFQFYYYFLFFLISFVPVHQTQHKPHP
jgi:hypothetical protein